MKRFFAFLLAVLVLIPSGTIAHAAMQDTGFTDVASSAWYADAVMYVREQGIMSGTAPTTFSPDAGMTRGMLAAVLYRMAGQPAVSGADTFSDTAADTWYTNAVLWAFQTGLMSGYNGNRFGIDDPVTREQLAAVIWRYAGEPAPSAAETAFADESAIPAYARDAVYWARVNNIITGKEGNLFDPKGSASRAQVAVILYHYQTLEPSASTTPSAETGRTLVAYFSRVGNTRLADGVDALTSASINLENGSYIGNNQIVAESIHARVGGDLMEITAAEPYPVDYEETVSQNRQEQQDETLPPLSSQIDTAEYDRIFIGYPIWAMTLPAPVKTFLTENDFTGKTIVPFCTHAGYGAGRTEELIRELCPGAQVLPVLAVDDDDLVQADTLTASWLRELGL